MNNNKYKVSDELLGHALDVRSVDSCDTFILSGSKDTTVKIWKLDGSHYAENLSLKDDSNFNGVACILQTNAGTCICVARNDSKIGVYLEGNATPINVLGGHLLKVSALAAGVHSGSLLSGSEDRTARVWTISSLTESASIILNGHQAAVETVTASPTGKFITGSADGYIIYWSANGDILKTFKGHQKGVCCLLVLPNNQLASSDNDAGIKIWNEEGECLRELGRQINGIYGIARNRALGDSVFVTTGKDNQIFVWNTEGQLGKFIASSARSVRSVTCLSNGDIVTGSCDGIIRIFTRDPACTRYVSGSAAASESNAGIVNPQAGSSKLIDLPEDDQLEYVLRMSLQDAPHVNVNPLYNILNNIQTHDPLAETLNNWGHVKLEFKDLNTKKTVIVETEIYSYTRKGVNTIGIYLERNQKNFIIEATTLIDGNKLKITFPGAELLFISGWQMDSFLTFIAKEVRKYENEG